MWNQLKWKLPSIILVATATIEPNWPGCAFFIVLGLCNLFWQLLENIWLVQIACLSGVALFTFSHWWLGVAFIVVTVISIRIHPPIVEPARLIICTDTQDGWEWKRWKRDWAPCEIRHSVNWNDLVPDIEPNDYVLIATSHTPLPGANKCSGYIYELASKCARVTLILDNLPTRDYAEAIKFKLPSQVTAICTLGPNSRFWTILTSVWTQYGPKPISDLQLFHHITDECVRQHMVGTAMQITGGSESKMFLR